MSLLRNLGKPGPLLLLVMATCFGMGCAAEPDRTSAPAGQRPVISPTSQMLVAPQCSPPPIVVPTPPRVIPAYLEVDPATGLHMTGTVQQLDITDYRLKIGGKVDNPLSLTYDDLRCLPKTKATLKLICPGFFEDTGSWAGTPLQEVLSRAGVQTGADTLRLASADGYVTHLPLAMAASGFLAYEWEGEPLPVLHGFPVRAVFPGEAGGTWVKWLVEIGVN